MSKKFSNTLICVGYLLATSYFINVLSYDFYPITFRQSVLLVFICMFLPQTIIYNNKI